MKITLSLAALTLVLCASCSAPMFSVEPTYGRLNLQGDLALTNSGSPVVHNSLDDLGVGGNESSLGVRADLGWSVPHLTLATQSAGWSGSGTVTNFGGIAGANVAVNSKMDLAVHRALITFDVSPSPNHTTISGASATFGIAWNMTMNG